LAEEKLLQREREAEQRRIEEREREKERLEKERDNDARRRPQTAEKPISATGGYVPPWRRSTESPTTNREEGGALPGPWRRSVSGRGTVPEDGSRRREPESEWRRSDSGREDTEKRKPEPSRRTAEEMEWRRSDSGRGSTNEEKTWRRTSTSSREEPSTKQEVAWRRGGPPPSDRGDRSDSKWTKSREDSWRKDSEDSDQTSPSSSRGSTRILKSEGSWRPRARQSEQKLGDQDDQFHDEPEEDESLFRSEDNLKSQAPVSSGRQNVPIEPDEEGFIPVTKGKRRGKNQLGHGQDLE